MIDYMYLALFGEIVMTRTPNKIRIILRRCELTALYALALS